MTFYAHLIVTRQELIAGSRGELGGCLPHRTLPIQQALQGIQAHVRQSGILTSQQCDKTRSRLPLLPCWDQAERTTGGY